MIVTVVIPTFNEDGNVGRLIHETFSGCASGNAKRGENRNAAHSVADGALNERRG